MAKKLLIYAVFLIVLSACSQEEVKETTADSPITLTEVENALKEEGFQLKKATLSDENSFVQKLNGVLPAAYYVKDNVMSVYIFPSGNDRAESIGTFQESTAATELVEYQAYGLRNILVFYVSEDDGLQSKLFDALKTLDPPAKSYEIKGEWGKWE